jgi:imidazolonepropionase-like amidohydrolase
MNRPFLALIVALLLVAAVAGGEEPQYFAIRNARIVPGGGPAIENGVVVIRGGLIAAVGANPIIPPAALVIDGKGLTVYPGLIDALSTLGLPEAAPATTPGTPRTVAPPPSTPSPPGAEPQPPQGPEDRPHTTPWVCAADLVSPADPRLEAARAAGFTSAMVVPPRGNIAGYGALINLAGERPGQMVVKTPVALYTTFTVMANWRRYPGSLIGIIAYLKQTFMDARYYQQAWAAYRAEVNGNRRPAYDRALEGLEPVVAGRAPVLLAAQTEVQIRRYLELGRQFGLPFLLYGVHEGYTVAPVIAQSRAPVLVSAKWPARARELDPENPESLRTLRLRDRAPSTPVALEKAGVRFAFYSDGISSYKEMLRNVKKAIDAGLPAEAALRALTLTPAQLFGVADSLGSIEPGKIANLVVADGDLFAEKTRIKYVFVDGKKFTVPEGEARPERAPAVAGTGARKTNREVN